MIRRRAFVLAASLSGIGIRAACSPYSIITKEATKRGKKIGIIGLDTSHSVAFTKELNNPKADNQYLGYRVVAAYPYGSKEILSSSERIPGYTDTVRNEGAEIVASIEELLEMVDVVLLETNDGRLHLSQARLVIKSGKPLFVDKPITSSLAEALLLYEMAAKFEVPIFSSSSLRYIAGMDEVLSGEIGNITGAETYSPAKLEKTHPDLFWYGIHGVETLYTAMGTGCQSVVRVSSEDTDLVVGTWKDGRIGTFRGIRKGTADYGGTVFGDKGIKTLGKYNGYNLLLEKIINFFETGIAPVKPDETLEILAFMEAADLSKANNGVSVKVETIFENAREANRIKMQIN